MQTPSLSTFLVPEKGRNSLRELQANENRKQEESPSSVQARVFRVQARVALFQLGVCSAQLSRALSSPSSVQARVSRVQARVALFQLGVCSAQLSRALSSPSSVQESRSFISKGKRLFGAEFKVAMDGMAMHHHGWQCMSASLWCLLGTTGLSSALSSIWLHPSLLFVWPSGLY